MPTVMVTKFTAKDIEQANLDNWPTRFEDQRTAIGILTRHTKRYGHVKLVEDVQELNTDGSSALRITFPAWFHELAEHFRNRYEQEQAEALFAKTVRWILQELLCSAARP